jgi:hypothetical protein
MTFAKWSALGSESSVAGTALDSKASGATTFVADYDNTTAKDIYLGIWVTLGSINASSGASITVSLRRKRSSTYADNDTEIVVIPINSGTSAKNAHAVIRIPNAGIYGVYWTNNTGTTSAATGNSMFLTPWNEEIN